MNEETPPTTRNAGIARYRPIRASIQAVLAEAVKLCKKPDLDRAAKHLDLVDRAQLDDGQTFAMLCDVALFEPNQRGRRVIDRFLATRTEALNPADRVIARRFGTAFFSIFRVSGWHEAGGVWLDDLLAPERRLWLMDENLEASAPEGIVIAMRVFDAGPFHAGFGLAVQPDAEAIALCSEAASRGRPLPVRYALSAALYGDAIAEALMPGVLDDLTDLIDAAAAGAAPLPRPTPSRRRRSKGTS